MRKWILLLPVLLFAGCETTTIATKVDDNTWWVCDADEVEKGEKPTAACGANPEKGLNRTCFSENKAIINYRRMPDNSIIVTCADTTAK